MNSADDKPEDSHSIAERLYSKEFLRNLGERFSFDAMATENAADIRHIGHYYLATSRAQKSEKKFIPSERKLFAQFHKEINRIIDRVRALENDIPLLMQFGAVHITNSPDRKSAHSRKFKYESGEQHYQELLYRLESLQAGIAFQHEQLKSPPGPKPDDALKYIVRHAARFWEERLNRNFSLDYHKGAGTTPAFDFVRALIEPLADISDTKIITAMRAEIGLRSMIARGDQPLH